MKNRKLGFIAIILTAILIFAACSQSSQFEGHWIIHAPFRASDEYIFRRGGEGIWAYGIPGSHVEIPITWNTSDGRLEIFIDGQPVPRVYYYEFVDDDTLMLRRIDWPEGTGLNWVRID